MKRIHLSKLYICGALLTVLLFLLTGRAVYTHVTVQYAFDPTGDVIVTAYDGEKILDEREVCDGRADLYFWGVELTGISPIHYDAYEELLIENIQIRVHGFLAAELSPEEIMEAFAPNDGIREMYLTKQGVYLTTDSDQPVLQTQEGLLTRLERAAVVMSFWNLLFYLLIYTLVYWYLFGVLDLVHHHGYGELLDAVLGLVGVAALLLSWGIAFSSAYGVTVHPDEMQTRAAVDYYRTHWIQPDVRSELVAETVSGYGMTRLSEINLYYLFAGKLANVFDFEMSFRASGMLMILVLSVFVLKNVKKERFVAVLFFLTPQLWYLFSYATSDAYDYLFTVFATYEVLAEGSVLNRILKEPFRWRQLPAYVGMGFVFANLLMAKKSFYVVLLTLFFLLLYRMIFAEKTARVCLLKKYLCLLGVAFAIVLVRYAPDFGYYGLHKGAAVDQVIEETAWTEYKPSTPAVEQAKSTLLYEKGVTLKEFFTDWHFNGELFKNYFGYYGIYSLRAKDWYYVLMSVLYLVLFATVGVLVHRGMKQRTQQGLCVLRERVTCWTMWGMMLLMYLLTVYNAYFVDFQPQGRYLFPALPALACQIALYKEVEEHFAVRTLVTVIAVVSLYSFYKIAFLNF